MARIIAEAAADDNIVLHPGTGAIWERSDKPPQSVRVNSTSPVVFMSYPKRHIGCEQRFRFTKAGSAMTPVPLVLIVEDHDDTREMLQLLLSIFGCRAIAARDGEEAMSLAENKRPDLILMDMTLPRLDGLSLTRIIRAHPTLNQVPIVAMTGLVTTKFHNEALSAGCNDYLDKPIDFDRLEELVKALTPAAPQRTLHNLVRSPHKTSPHAV